MSRSIVDVEHRLIECGLLQGGHVRVGTGYDGQDSVDSTREAVRGPPSSTVSAQDETPDGVSPWQGDGAGGAGQGVRQEGDGRRPR